LYYSPIVTQIKEDELGGACGTHMEQTYRALVGAVEVQNPLGRPRLTWEVNVKMNVQEIG